MSCCGHHMTFIRAMNCGSQRHALASNIHPPTSLRRPILAHEMEALCLGEPTAAVSRKSLAPALIPVCKRILRRVPLARCRSPGTARGGKCDERKRANGKYCSILTNEKRKYDSSCRHAENRFCHLAPVLVAIQSSARRWAGERSPTVVPIVREDNAH